MVFCSLVEGPESGGDEVVEGSLAGGFVSSLQRLRDLNNKPGAFFVFGDISVKMEGIFRLRFTLHEVRDWHVYTLATVLSDPFEMHVPKTFPGLSESTHLTRAFREQGVMLRVRKAPSAALRKRGPASDSYEPRTYKKQDDKEDTKSYAEKDIKKDTKQVSKANRVNKTDGKQAKENVNFEGRNLPPSIESSASSNKSIDGRSPSSPAQPDQVQSNTHIQEAQHGWRPAQYANNSSYSYVDEVERMKKDRYYGMPLLQGTSQQHQLLEAHLDAYRSRPDTGFQQSLGPNSLTSYSSQSIYSQSNDMLSPPSQASQDGWLQQSFGSQDYPTPLSYSTTDPIYATQAPATMQQDAYSNFGPDMLHAMANSRCLISSGQQALDNMIPNQPRQLPPPIGLSSPPIWSTLQYGQPPFASMTSPPPYSSPESLLAQGSTTSDAEKHSVLAMFDKTSQTNIPQGCTYYRSPTT